MTAAVPIQPESMLALRKLSRLRRSEHRWQRVSWIVGIVMMIAVIAVCVVRPFLPLPSPNAIDLTSTLLPPSSSYWFGTDDVGRDLLSRVLAGLTLDLYVSLAVTGLSVLIGVTMGALAGFFGGVVDAVIMRLADIVLAFPFLVLVIAMVAVFGPGLTPVFVAVPAASWALYARFTRAEVVTVKQRDFVNAAATLGFRKRRVLIRHVLPNVVQPSIAFFPLDFVGNMVLLASLSYLGLGVQPPTAELGGIINDGQQYIADAWWITVIPGIVLVFVGISLSLIGDGLAAKLGQTDIWGK